jgi:RNA polymerase sigma factor, sigma-70 family
MVKRNSSQKAAEREEPEIYDPNGRVAIVRLFVEETAQPGQLSPEEEVSLMQAYSLGRLAKANSQRAFEELPKNLREAALKLAKETGSPIKNNDENQINRQLPLILRELDRQGTLAYRRLLEAFTNLVIFVAKIYTNRLDPDWTGLDFADLIQEGFLGLTRGLEHFDLDTGCRVSGYVVWWIRQGVTRALIDKGNVMRISVHTSEMISKVFRAMEKLTQAGTPASIEAISRETGIAPRRVKEVLNAAIAQSPDSIDRTNVVIPEELEDMEDFRSNKTTNSPLADNEIALIDTIPAPEDIERTLETAELRATITEALNELPPEMANVLRLRFGFGCNEPQTLEQTGHRMGLNREKVRRLKSRALTLAREELKITPALHEFIAQ